MSSMNKVILIGNLGKNPEARFTQSNKKIVTFSLATSKSWIDKATNEKKSTTTWHNLKAFEKLADVAESYLKKGNKVYVEGEINNNEYEKDGQKIIRTEILVRDIVLLTPVERPQEEPEKPAQGGYELNDEIPF